MITYLLHGVSITREQAHKRWTSSRTYKRAALKDSIWPSAEQQITEQGELVPVLFNHLAEVGLSMERSND